MMAILRVVITRSRRAELPFLAAGVAYYALLSIVPLLVLSFSIAAFFGRPELADWVIGRLEPLLTAEGEDVLERLITSSKGQTTATIIGVLTLIWGTLKIFRGLDTAFEIIYGQRGDLGLLDQLQNAVVVLSSIGLALIVLVGIELLIGFVVPRGWLRGLGILGLFLGLVVIFLPIYVFYPKPRYSLKMALPGAIVAAGSWTTLGTLLGIYTAVVRGSSVIGILGAVLLALTWLYLGLISVLAAAVFNSVLAEGPIATNPEVDNWLSEMDDHSPEILAERIERLEVSTQRRKSLARSWGPYIVLLYGTVMTLGAFYFVGGWASVAAMFVIWLSTLGLYAIVVGVGVIRIIGSIPGRLRRLIRKSP